MGCAGLVGAYLWPMGGAPTVKSCYLLRLFGFAVGAWASTGDNWASPLVGREPILQYRIPYDYVKDASFLW